MNIIFYISFAVTVEETRC